MRRPTPAAILLPLALAGTLAAASRACASSSSSSSSSSSNTHGAAGANAPCPRPDEELAILAGQHVLYSYGGGSQPPAELLARTRAGLVGGVILFGVNMDAGTAAATRALKAAYRASPAPALLARARTGRAPRFLVATDQEGGQVRRVRPGQPEQSAKQIGAARDPAAAAAAAGRAAADTLAAVGVNVNLAPVLDVFRRPRDFADFYERSFGDTPQRVAVPAVAFIRAQQQAGVAATAKHFPGLGDAAHEANTDDRPVTLTTSLANLTAIDMAPYTPAIAAGVQLVMASWAVYPALDPVYPPGLSPGPCPDDSKWIKGQLRDRLAFTGVTITDAMEAGSVAAFGDAATTAKMAANAGMDILLASSRNVSQGDVIRQALVDGLRAGELDMADFDAATQRIAQLRSTIAE